MSPALLSGVRNIGSKAALFAQYLEFARWGRRKEGDKYRRFEGRKGKYIALQCFSIILVCSLNVAAMFLFNLYWRRGQLNEKSSIGDHHLGRSPMPMGTTESPEIF